MKKQTPKPHNKTFEKAVRDASKSKIDPFNPVLNERNMRLEAHSEGSYGLDPFMEGINDKED